MPRLFDPSRDLLFGMLALQGGLIDETQLVRAFQSWTKDRDCPLGEHLLARGDLNAEQFAAVEAMLALHLKKHADETQQSLAAIPALRSTIASLTSVADRALDASLTHVGLDSTLGFDVPDHTVSRSVGSAASKSQRFRILRLHARGALGAVFVADDTELHREVAVKEILDNHGDDPVSRARFVLEAEVTGGLEHPGIVPVYGLGTYPDGRPFYAMRFIRGDSLKAAIEQFHADPELKRDPGRKSLELRKLLRRFTDVCNAIDYAHNRGVLHRDIKPSNIIVGKYGETLVVDWGLAKPLGCTEPDLQAGEQPLVLSLASGSTETLPGLAMGTPAYMSPEQAEGDLENLGPRSDVYGLGATFYCLLTDRPPAEGADIVAVLGAVKRGDFTHPRKLNASIDKALEAICLKAMALRPADRYATPRALADDVELWLADEPVAAYPDPRIERLRRWLRHHRTWTFAAAAALIGITLAATVAVAVIEGGRRREERARKEAETNFVMAQSAVKDYLTSVSENTLLKQQDSVDIRSLRKELLSTALRYYKDFVDQRNDDPNLREQLANAYFRVGEITQEIDSQVEAIEAFCSAQKIWRALAAADPGNDEIQGHVADCHVAIGKQQSAVGDLHGAMASFQPARAILETLAARHPQLAYYQTRLADCHTEIAIVEGRLDSGDLGLGSLEKAQAIQKALITRYPGEVVYRQRLAEIINVLGFGYTKSLDHAEAIRCFEEVQEICESLLEQVTVGAKPVSLLNLLALSHYNVAATHMANRRFDPALESLAKSLKYRSELVAAHPSVTRFQENLGETYEVIADIQYKAHHDDEAFASVQKSIAILEQLVQSHPDRARHHGSLGRSYNCLGYFHDEQRHNRLAIPAFEKAVKEQERAIAQSPDDDEFKVLLGIQLDNLGEQYVDLGQVDRALPFYRQGIQVRRRLFAAHPERLAYRVALAEALCTLGTIERHAGDLIAASEMFFDARTLLERGAAPMSGDEAFQVLSGMALIHEASALADLREPEKARPLLERAVKTLSKRLKSGRAEAQRREWRSNGLWQLARVFRVLTNTKDAERLDAERVAVWRDRPSSELVAFALKQASLAALIGYGKTPIAPAGQAVRELDLDQAAANLQLAVSQGFRDFRKVQSHPDSKALLARDDIKLLIMDMAFPDQAFGKR